MTIGSVSASTVSTLLGARNPEAARRAYDLASTSTPATSGDKVSISEAGRSASRAEQGAEADPLKAYRLPGWMADYGFNVKIELASISSDGKTMSGGSKYTDNPTYGVDQSDQLEYSKLINGHFQQLTKDYGGNDSKAYYERLLDDKEFSETVRLDMLDRVRNDTRLVALLPKVGKSFLLD